MEPHLSITDASSPYTAGIWFCRSCFEVQLLGAAESAPRSWEQDSDLQRDEDDEQTAFLRKHFGHPLSPLKKKKDRHFSDRPVWDPFRIAYEEVTDGRETYILKSWRTDLDEPRRYTLLRGTLEVSTTVQLPEEPLREELSRTFSCSPQQAEMIVDRLQRVVASLPAEELLPAYCAADDPELLFSYLNEHHLRKCVEVCQARSGIFDKAKLRDFFVQHQQDDALMLEVRHSYRPHFL
ncbi:MAG: hypothetical protein AB7P69_10095 [Candidatus Binatia bacterium]